MSNTPMVDALEKELGHKGLSPMLRYPVVLAQARTLERELHRERELHDALRRQSRLDGPSPASLLMLWLLGVLMGAGACAMVIGSAS